MRRSNYNRALLIFALVLCLASCSDTTEPQATDRVPTADPAMSTTTTAPETIAAILGHATSEAAWINEHVRGQEQIRVCMAEQGFEYLPIPHQDEYWTEERHEETLATSGLGITTLFGGGDPLTGLPTDKYLDPNEERLATMPDSERTAWEGALSGTEEERQQWTDAYADLESGELRPGAAPYPGCASMSYAGASAMQDRMQDELGAELEAMNERVNADPRFIEAERRWTDCMASAGYDGLPADPSEARMQLEEALLARLGGIVGDGEGWVYPLAGWTDVQIEEFYAEHSQEEIDTIVEDARRRTAENVDLDALAILHQDEIEMSLADFKCAKSVSETHNEVRAEYEAQFVASNRALLQSIRDSAD